MPIMISAKRSRTGSSKVYVRIGEEEKGQDLLNILLEETTYKTLQSNIKREIKQYPLPLPVSIFELC